MWLVKVGSERVGAKVVRYTLLTLIVFMLLCTILAIILVTFASNYSTALNDRTQGIILILLLIGLNYAVGLVALVKCKTAVLALFGVVDLCLACLCMLSTHQGHHIGNWGALVMFASTCLLSGVVVLQSCHSEAVRRTCSVQNASVNCYHQSSEDCYDFGSTSTSEKDELIPSHWLTQPLPFHHNRNCDLSAHEETALPSGTAVARDALHRAHPLSGTICTVETNEEHFLRGDRYAL